MPLMVLSDMMGLLILWTTLGLPLALGILFRVNTSHLFFSLMAGELIARYFAHDVESLAKPLVRDAAMPADYGEMALLVLPMLLTAVFLKGTLRKSKLLLHLLPLAITGIVLAAFLLPLLPEDLQQEIQVNQAGNWLLHLNKVIIGAVVAIQLVALWIFNRSDHEKKAAGQT